MSEDTNGRVNLKDLLTSCSDGSGTPEQHKLVEHTYAKAINSQLCPCGSENTFGECCKMTWNLFTRMQSRTKEAVKENNKEVRKENEAVKIDESNIEWLLEIGVKDGQVVVKQNSKPGIPASEAARILLNAHYNVSVAAQQQAITFAIQNLVQQVSGEQRMPIIKGGH